MRAGAEALPRGPAPPAEARRQDLQAGGITPRASPRITINTTETCYILYLLIGIPLTIWVGQTLHRNGRVFLRAAFPGRAELADSVNHLVLFGFCLSNVGQVLLGQPLGTKPGTVQGAFEFLATKLGLVLLVLGAMHFFSMLNFDKMRSWARPTGDAAIPPVIAR